MMHDARLLGKLTVRHARTAAMRHVYVLGTDPLQDRSGGDRAYQLYIGLIALACLVLIWAALLNAVAGAGAALSPDAFAAVLRMASIVPVVLFGGLAFKGLFSSPLKLSHPDIAFVASSPLGMGSIAVVGFAAAALPFGVVAALLGYGLGVGIEANGSTQAYPGGVAGMAALLGVSALGAAWVAGAAKLAVQRTRTRREAAALLAAVSLVVAMGAAAVALVAMPIAFFEWWGMAAACSGMVVLIAGEIALLAALAQHVDMRTLIEENALYAALQPYNAFSPLDPSMVADYRRSIKVAARTPHLHLLSADGRRALIARAALSLLRQREGAAALIGWGAVAAPLGVFALLGAKAPILLAVWAAAVLLFPQGREVTRAFRDDMRVRLVRDRLPFSTVELLACDSLPAYIVVAAVSSVVIAGLAPAGVPLVPGIALGMLINAALVLSRGLDAIRLYPGGPRPCFEAGAAAFIAIIGGLASVASPSIVVGIAAAACVVLARLIRNGVECAP